MICLGLMSGTSTDGVDCAIVDVRGGEKNPRVKLLQYQTKSYTPAVRDQVLLAASRGNVSQLCHLHVLLGEIFAQAALRTIKKAGLTPEQVQLIGSHGQTIYHRPVPVRVPGVGVVRSSLQMGDPSVIAERTGITTVADFRARDLAAGGEGAPLAPYVHHLLLQSTRFSRLVVNMGGIANVTHLPKNAPLPDIRAFDTGPCNMLLDGLIALATQGQRAMDRGGRFAARGTPDSRLLTRLLNHPYLMRRPPKSTGREDFGVQYVRQVWQWGRKLRLSPETIMATACQFIVLTIDQSRAWLENDVDEVIVGGGGVHNRTLMEHLRQRLSPLPVTIMDDQGINSKAFEAIAFAIMAYQTVHGVATNVPSVTGAHHPVVLGTISPGRYVPSFHG